MKLVFVLDVVAVGNDHPCHKPTKWSNAIPLSNSNDRGVDVGSSSLERAVRIGNGTTRVVVEMAFNVAADNTA